MADKTQLLQTLAGTVCPICQRVKHAQQWTCADCYRPYKDSPEHVALSDSCDVHMAAADEFLQMVKWRQQKPETD